MDIGIRTSMGAIRRAEGEMIRHRPMRPLVSGPHVSIAFTIFGIILLLLFVLLHPSTLY